MLCGIAPCFIYLADILFVCCRNLYISIRTSVMSIFPKCLKRQKQKQKQRKTGAGVRMMRWTWHVNGCCQGRCVCCSPAWARVTQHGCTSESRKINLVNSSRHAHKCGSIHPFSVTACPALQVAGVL